MESTGIERERIEAAVVRRDLSGARLAWTVYTQTGRQDIQVLAGHRRVVIGYLRARSLAQQVAVPRGVMMTSAEASAEPV